MRDVAGESASLKYLSELFAQETPLMQKSKELMATTGKEGQAVSAIEGKMLASLVKLFKVEKIVELGCFVGYSALWMADAISTSNGKLYTFEYNKDHADMAKIVFDQYEGSTDIKLLVGNAKDHLQDIEADGPFDLVFIDANKASYGEYFEWARQNLKVGGIVIGDNSLLYGQVGLDNPERVSKNQWKGMRAFNESLAAAEEFESFYVPTSEGMSIGVKTK